MASHVIEFEGMQLYAPILFVLVFLLFFTVLLFLKSPMQFFVDDLVVGVVMLSISSLEMERLFPSFLEKVSGMKS